MHGKGGSKKSSPSESSGGTEKTNVRTTQNNVMEKAYEKLGEAPTAGGAGQNINIRTKNSGGPNAASGAWAVTKKYGGATLKAATSAALKTATAATGAMLGFAGGVAKGDISEALKGAAAGGATGAGLASSGIKFASNIKDNVKNLENDIQDTYNGGAYGSEYAENMKMIRAYKQTSDYKELKNLYKDQLTDEKLIEILNAAKEEAKK